MNNYQAFITVLKSIENNSIPVRIKSENPNIKGKYEWSNRITIHPDIKSICVGKLFIRFEDISNIEITPSEGVIVNVR